MRLFKNLRDDNRNYFPETEFEGTSPSPKGIEARSADRARSRELVLVKEPGARRPSAVDLALSLELVLGEIISVIIPQILE